MRLFYIGARTRSKSAERKIFLYRHERKYLAAFRNVAHAALHHLMRGNAGDILAGKTQRAAGRLFHAGDHAQDGRLPCSVRADQRNDLTSIDLERDIKERLQVTVIGRDVADFQQGLPGSLD